MRDSQSETSIKAKYRLSSAPFLADMALVYTASRLEQPTQRAVSSSGRQTSIAQQQLQPTRLLRPPEPPRVRAHESGETVVAN